MNTENFNERSEYTSINDADYGNAGKSGFDGQDLGEENAQILSRSSFEESQRRAIRRRKVHTALTICAALAVVIIFASACVSVFLRIGEISVDGLSRYEEGEIIAASGIDLGQNIYAINKAEIEKAITTSCPYIKSVKIRRNLPDTLSITVYDEEPRYYFELCGEYFVLSESMRVLERTNSMTNLLLDYEQIIKLKTQSVKRAVVGDVFVFDNASYLSYAREMLNTFANSELGRNITLVDFSNRFAIYFVYGDRLRVDVGSIEDINKKITIASRIISKLDARDKGTINVENDPAYYIIGTPEF